MKASFTLANPRLTGLYWSFMPEISKDTQVGDGDGVDIRDRKNVKWLGVSRRPKMWW